MLKANQVVKRTENAVRVNRVVLDTLTAGLLGPAYAIQGDFDAYPKGLKVEPLLTRALDDHPTVQRLTRFVQRAEHGIEFQRQARVPNVTVNGGYYREIGREAYIAGVSVPTPIWYQRQGEVAEALGVKRRDEAELLRAKNLLVKESINIGRTQGPPPNSLPYLRRDCSARRRKRCVLHSSVSYRGRPAYWKSWMPNASSARFCSTTTGPLRSLSISSQAGTRIGRSAVLARITQCGLVFASLFLCRQSRHTKVCLDSKLVD